MVGRTARRGVAAALALLLSVALMPLAAADGDRLEVSLDGASWSSTLPDALFEDDVVLVPGQSATAQLHLRSTAPTTGALELALTNLSASDRWAAQSFGLRVELGGARRGDALGSALPRTRVDELEEGTRLGRPVLLETGEAVTLTVTIDLDEHTTGDRAQNSTIGLDLEITFSDAHAIGAGESGEDARSGHSRESTPPRVLPILAPGESTPHQVPNPGVEHAGERAALRDPRTPSRDRGLLPVTDIPALAGSTAGLAVLLLGVRLLFVVRTRMEEKR